MNRSGLESSRPASRREPRSPTRQRILTVFGKFLDLGGLFEHTLSLTNHGFAEWRDGDCGRATLEELHTELLFQFLDG